MVIQQSKVDRALQLYAQKAFDVDRQQMFGAWEARRCVGTWLGLEETNCEDIKGIEVSRAQARRRRGFSMTTLNSLIRLESISILGCP